jgi:trk system potassium uptake protein TrkH
VAASRGQGSVAWRARPGHVLRTVAAHGLVLAAVTGVPALAALAEGETALAVALGLPALACALVGAPAVRLWRITDLRGIEALATLVALFALAALLPIPAFRVLGLGPGDALFEAVSAITSTGLTVASGTADWPVSAHLMRGWLQWAGGFAIAVAGVAVIVGPGAAMQTLGKVGLEQRDLLRSTRAQARQLLAIYGALTLLGILLLLPLLPSWWEAVSIGLAAVSTGGFTPRADSLASYSRAAQSAVLLLCLSTSLSLLAYVLIRRRGPLRALRETNAGAVLLVLLAGLGVIAALGLALPGDAAGGLGTLLLTQASALTTAGFSVAPMPAAPALLVVLLAAMVVGGGAGSTAGGIKVDRVATMLRMIGLTLLRLRTPPRAVTTLKQGGAPVSGDRIVSLVAVVACYGLTALLAWIVFLASGAAPLAALFDIVSALSTVGLSSGLTGPELAPHLKLVLAATMFLGRLEFLAVLVALSPATWTPRRSQ